MDYIVSPLAEADLEEIWLYIASDNPNAADRLIGKIFETVELITTSPLMGRMRNELASGLRSFGAQPYIIFYRPLPDAIEIVRVLHGSRDIDTIFH